MFYAATGDCGTEELSRLFNVKPYAMSVRATASQLHTCAIEAGFGACRKSGKGFERFQRKRQGNGQGAGAKFALCVRIYMVEKLRKNYSLSLWLTRLFFYISFVFCNWFDIESAFNYMSYAGLFGLALERSFWLMAASGLIGAVITEVLFAGAQICSLRIENSYGSAQ